MCQGVADEITSQLFIHYKLLFSHISIYMSYQVLARRLRPRNFASVVGQQATLQALKNALDTKQLHHAYLFTGTRGTGKTTIARILAKCLSCQIGISSTACNQCNACTSIDKGNWLDVIEIDAASRTKVEDIRELLDNIPYSPVQSRYKIYIIDEVHMLSNHSFNALLKTLEEPPMHVKFLLATTDPQKLPVTILSRCLQFHLHKFSQEQTIPYLAKILQDEQIKFEEAALQHICMAADGSLRDALSFLEQLISLDEKIITENNARKLLGITTEASVLNLLHQIISGNAQAIFDMINDLYNYEADFLNILKSIQMALHQIALIQVIPEAINKPELQKLALMVSPEDVQLYYQIAVNGMRDLPYVPNIKIGFEMIILRMLAFLPVQIHKNHNNNINNNLNGINNNKKLDQEYKLNTEYKNEKSREINLPEAIRELNLTGLTKVIAEHCSLESWDNNVIKLSLHSSKGPLLNERHIQKLQDAFKLYLKQNVKLQININSSSPVNNSAYNNLKQEIQSDIHIKKLQQLFDAKVEDFKII